MQAQTEKTPRKLATNKTKERRKIIIIMRLQIAAATTRTEIISIKRMFMFLATAS